MSLLSRCSCLTRFRAQPHRRAPSPAIGQDVAFAPQENASSPVPLILIPFPVFIVGEPPSSPLDVPSTEQENQNTLALVALILSLPALLGIAATVLAFSSASPSGLLLVGGLVCTLVGIVTDVEGLVLGIIALATSGRYRPQGRRRWMAILAIVLSAGGFLGVFCLLALYVIGLMFLI